MLPVLPILHAGATVAFTSHLGTTATVVEVLPDGSVELDTGQTLPPAAVVLQDTGESWKPVTGYDGRYLVSSHGKVVSTYYRQTARTRLLRVLAPQRYPAVALSNAAGVMQVGLNRLVAQHFLPSPADARLTVVLPHDGNHLNLHADNLQWVDPREIEDVDVAPRLHPRGERHGSTRLTTAQVVEIRRLVTQGTTKQSIAGQFGVSRPTISQIAHGHSRRHA